MSQSRNRNNKMGSRNRRRRRVVVYQRSGGRCVYCKERLSLEDMTLDHVVPRGEGGTDAIKNLVASCATCNHDKDDKSAITFVQR